MASIGTLTADLKLQSAAFLRDLTKASRAVESNTAQMRKSMREVERSSRDLSKQFSQLRGAAVALAGALAVRQFGQFAKAAIDSADAIAKQADRIGISTRALQEYRTVAGLAGVETSRLDQGLGAFVKRLGELRAGTGALATILNKSNEALRDQLVTARSTEEALQIFLRALAQTANQADRVALSAAAFSRTAGIEMANLVKNGAESVEQMRQSLIDLGLVMEDRVLRQAERLQDDLALLQQSFKVGFDTAIIEGLAGSFDSTAESLKEANRVGAEFGRIVGASMRAVVEAAKFVANNIREIGAALAFIVGMKAAGVVLGLARAFTAFALAVRAAALASGLFAAAQAGLKKGLVGLAGAAAAILAFTAAAKKIAPELEEAEAAIREFGDASSGAARGATATEKAVKKSTEALKKEAENTKILIGALQRSTEEYERFKTAIEIQAEAARVGAEPNTELGEAWLQAAVEAARLKKELADLEKAQKDAADAAKRHAEEQQRQKERMQDLLLEPFRNATRAIQAEFSETFEEFPPAVLADPQTAAMIEAAIGGTA